MEDLKQSVLESLDGTANPQIYPYLPYILQDLWELGTDPQLVLALVSRHVKRSPLKILDLGCGKGAVSINLAKNLNCSVLGIDGLSEFILEAQMFAEKHKVADHCVFEVADAREKISEIKGFDLVILGAVGQILGTLNQTLSKIATALNPEGFVVMDDGWVEDDYSGVYQRCHKKSDFYKMIEDAGFELVDEFRFDSDSMNEANRRIHEPLTKRVIELIQREPEKRTVFEEYLKSQEYEISMMSGDVKCTLCLLKMK